MANTPFTLYHAGDEVVAVTNPVQQTIMERLEVGPVELADLVAATGKSKPTLSGTHLKSLAQQGLVGTHTHPDDSRRKVYRIEGKRIGSSDVPVDDLRRSVANHVQAPHTRGTLPLATITRAICLPGADLATIVKQGRALGAVLTESEPRPLRDHVMSWARFLEETGIATHTVLDMETPAIKAHRGGRVQEVDLAAYASLLVGLYEGSSEAIGDPIRLMGKTDGHAVHLDALPDEHGHRTEASPP